jgi:gliding motility-associated-like protein
LSATTGSPVTVINPTVTSSYIVTAMDGACTATATSTVTVDLTPTFSVNSIAICGGGIHDTLTAVGNATTYTWTPSTGLSSTSGNTVTATPTVTTTYTITGINGICSSTETSIVTISASPTLAVNSGAICSGGTMTLTASGANTYTWTPGTGLSSTTTSVVVANPTITTTYTVMGTTAGGCVGTNTSLVTVNATPTFSVNSIAICGGGANDTLTATGNAAIYSWTPATGLSATSGSTVTATPSVTTTYTITGANGTCSSTETATVTITSSPSVTVNSATICAGGTATLTAGGATSYTWSSTSSTYTASGNILTDDPAVITTYTVVGSAGTCSAIPGTAIVIVNPTPTVTVNSPTAICSGASTTLTVNGASTYSWMPGTGLSSTTASVVVANPTISTTYTVIGTSSGCVGMDTSFVTVNPTPTVSVNNPPAICFGDSTTLNAGGTTSYSWTPSTGLSSATSSVVVANPTITTTYSVTGTTGTCSSTTVTTVTITPLITINITPTTNTICAGSSATLTATGATTYSWTPTSTLSSASSGTVTATPSVTTTYTVMGSVGTCSAIPAVFTLTVTPIPVFSVTNSNPVFCQGDSSTLAVVSSGTIAATYIWSPTAGLNTTTGTTVTATPTVTTTYTVNATTGGCPSLPQITTITVHTVSPLSITPSSTIICNGNSTTLTTSNGLAVYTWMPTAAISGSTNTATVTATPTVTTTYSVTGQDAFGCHYDTTTAIVTVINITTLATSNSPVCKGSSINLIGNSVSGSPTYSWSGPNSYSSSSSTPSVSINNATVNDGGVYTLTVSVSGCLTTNTVNVIVNSLPIISVTPSTETVCPGTAATYTAFGALSYIWTPSSSLNSSTGAVVTANPSSTTVYSVSGTDGNGCSAIATVTINVNPVVANMSANPQTGNSPLSVQFTNLSTGGNSYVWNYGNGSNQTTISLTDTTTHTIYPNAGTYTVTLITSNTTGTITCMNEDTLVIIVTEAYSIIVPNVFTPNGDGINDNYMVKSEGVSALNVEIFDRWGLKMFSSSINSPWDGKTAGGKDAPDGTYFYLINATSNKGVSQEYKGFLTLIR